MDYILDCGKYITDYLNGDLNAIDKMFIAMEEHVKKLMETEDGRKFLEERLKGGF